MPRLRTRTTGAYRLKMIFYGSLLFVGCLYAYPYVDVEAAKTLLGVGMLLGPIAVLGGIIGKQDHSF